MNIPKFMPFHERAANCSAARAFATQNQMVRLSCTIGASMRGRRPELRLSAQSKIAHGVTDVTAGTLEIAHCVNGVRPTGSAGWDRLGVGP